MPVRITPDRAWPLLDTAATRQLEQAAAAALPAHTLMQRAGLATARLALALSPHAQTIWIACGPGNNGGDGLEAAMHLRRWGKAAVVTWLGTPAQAPPDTRSAWERASAAGVTLADAPPGQPDLVIDALLGIGANRAPGGQLADWAARMNAGPAPVLAVDVPSGLDADTGTGAAVRARWTLSLLALKPGLFTAGGRDACGDTWFDALDVVAHDFSIAPAAWLTGPPGAVLRPHASHKGSYGDVAVIGGAPGMGGAAVLAASAALRGGAGRVFTCLLDPNAPLLDTGHPELMLRAWATLDLSSMSVACGCGGGDAIRSALPGVLSTARALVLDADALNAIAADAALQTLLQARAGRPGRQTVLTPHPLEAARLLACDTAAVQADRLKAATALAQRFGAVVALKGSGTVVAAPGHTPCINPTGSARLATAGTGDVLAGLMAAQLAAGMLAFDAACSAVFLHGQAADGWPARLALTASGLASALRPA
ncbi:MAG: NAD(P)H-hydrate dehydratase [Ramlibacter sp.]